MKEIATNALFVLAVFVTLHVVVRIVFHAYFAARVEFVNHMIEKAKELSGHGKER